MKKILLAGCILAATAGTAAAGGSEGSVGVGGEFLTLPAGLLGSFGVGGPSINYDAGAFHVGGALMLIDPGGPDNTVLGVGGRFYYHAHSTALADFGVGGTLTFLNEQNPDPDDADNLVFIEPGIQVRAFLATNVALSFSAGFLIGAADADGVALIAGPVGGAGFHYYFF